MNDDSLKKLFDRIDVLDQADLRALAKTLWKQREFFKKTFEKIRDGIVVINDVGEIFYSNAAARELLGMKDLKQAGTLWKYIPEFVSLSKLDFRSMQGGDSFFSKEIRVSYPKKGILGVTITGGYTYEDSDTVFVLRIVDITEDRILTEQALCNEKFSSITLLASSVAHEIGNPLNAIALHLRLMHRQIKAKKNDNERAKFVESIDICLGEIERLDGIIKNFLYAIRPQKPNLSEIFPDKILSEVLDLVDAEFKSLHLKVINKVGQLPAIYADASQLKQVFFNILKNSCEAISGEGTVIIDGFSGNDDVTITFTDDGTGISCEVFDKIFQPYFSTKNKGTGLGMMIVERILRDHGATIDIASAKNSGTQISISFPRKDKCALLLNSESK